MTAMHESRLVRKTDPRTSVEAARRAAKASLRAMQAVEKLMKDGVDRIDEEIWQGCRAQGYLSSLSTVQHGRLALSESGVLIDSGTERNTSDNCPAIVWTLNPCGANSPAQKSSHSTESSEERVIQVDGGFCVQADIFSPLWQPPPFELAVADPPYGDGIVSDEWDQIPALELAALLVAMSAKLAEVATPGAHLWLWGGIGTPGERALYRALIGIEDAGRWQCAEQITWRKLRAYGTEWRCLMTREECLRFVLGDVKSPRVYHKQFTDEKRGYVGFNPKHPAKNENKRLTAIWDHASDMGQNKPHKCHKPAPLAESQILATTDPGDTVLDLFAGSGELSLVARAHGRLFVAYERDEETFKKLVQRLGGENESRAVHEPRA